MTLWELRFATATCQRLGRAAALGTSVRRHHNRHPAVLHAHGAGAVVRYRLAAAQAAGLDVLWLHTDADHHLGRALCAEIGLPFRGDFGRYESETLDVLNRVLVLALEDENRQATHALPDKYASLQNIPMSIQSPLRQRYQGNTHMNDASKTSIKTGTIGHVGAGKTTLTAALMRICADASGSTFAGIEKILTTRENYLGVNVNIARIEYDSKSRHFDHVDCQSHEDHVAALISGAAQIDGAILVCSAADGPTSQTREHIRLARLVGITHIVVFVNMADIQKDAARLDQVKKEVRAQLSTYDFPSDDTPIIIGSARMALEGKDDNEMGTTAVKKLVETLDSYIPEPERAIDKPFLMPIEDVFSISGRGTVVTGRIERGIVKVQDSLEIVGLRDTTTTVCTSVEMFRKLLDEGRAGDNCGLLLRGIKRENVEPGQVLAKPQSVTTYRKFNAEVYVLPKEEGISETPFINNYRPQFNFRTAKVIGNCELPDGIGEIKSGSNIQMTVSLIAPLAMEVGQRFTINDGKCTVGTGVVTEVSSN